MFGYVRTYDPDLKIAEYKTYKAIYCGLCKQLGRSFGMFARMTLSYDFAFLAAVAMAVGEDKPEIKTERCVCNPLHKSPCCTENPQLALAADAAMLMLWHKLRDNLLDDGFFKRLASRFLMLFARRPFEQAEIRNPAFAETLRHSMREQAQLEEAGCADVDAACEPTARALSVLLASLSQEASNQRVLERMGYLLGRFIYMADALDDLEDDLKHNGYNPFALRAQLGSYDSSAVEAVRQQAKGSLYLTIAELGRAYDLLTVGRLKGILDNVIYLGLKNSVDAVLAGAKPVVYVPREIA